MIVLTCKLYVHSPHQRLTRSNRLIIIAVLTHPDTFEFLHGKTESAEQIKLDYIL